MDKDYICSKCKKSGDRNAIPYRIIKETIDKEGGHIKFCGQFCEGCYKEIFQTNEQEKKTSK